MDIQIIDYGAGNIQSIKNALEKLDFEAGLTTDETQLQQADRVIFPGVGHAKAAMELLHQHQLVKVIPRLKQPVLGICLGMQLMCASTEEGDTEGLGIFDVKVKRFAKDLKVPQIGWNKAHFNDDALFKGIPAQEWMYFVHSFYVPENKYQIATADYGSTYASAMKKANFYAVQFHPEKSHKNGLQLIENFLKERL
jgi:glutamine amidotransferase